MTQSKIKLFRKYLSAIDFEAEALLLDAGDDRADPEPGVVLDPDKGALKQRNKLN